MNDMNANTNQAAHIAQFRALAARWQETTGSAAELELLVFFSPLRSTECFRILAEMGIR